MLICGGGSPKNFMLQTEPQIQEVLGIDEKGHDFFLQITDARPDTGGLSGATPAEAVSWGKIDPDRLPDAVVCYLDSTVALPLLTPYAHARHKKRPLKRLYDRRDEMMKLLRTEFEAVVANRASSRAKRGICSSKHVRNTNCTNEHGSNRDRQAPYPDEPSFLGKLRSGRVIGLLERRSKESSSGLVARGGVQHRFDSLIRAIRVHCVGTVPPQRAAAPRARDSPSRTRRDSSRGDLSPPRTRFTIVASLHPSAIRRAISSNVFD